MFYKLLSLICVSSLPFIFSLHGDFVFDDSEAIIKNKDITSDSWISPFHNDFWGTNIKSNLSHKSYRPLTILTFRLNYILSGGILSALHFKITNLVCHVMCCILVWLTFEVILNNQETKHKRKTFINTAYIATLIFAVHPVHVEAVSGIVGRADILAAITFFLAFLCYNRAITTFGNMYTYLFTTLLLATISMFFKENGITVLGYCFVYEFITSFKVKNSSKPNHKLKIYKYLFIDKKIVIRITSLTIAIILLLYVRWMIMDGMRPEFKPTDNPAAFSDDLFTRVSTYNYIYFLNILLLIWPQWLCYDWSMGCVPLIKHMLDYRIITILVIYVYGILLLREIYLTKRNATKRSILLSVSLVIIPFLPASNMFYPVGFVIAERILYIPSAGYCLLVTIGLNKIIKTRKSKWYKVRLLMSFLLIFIYALRSWQRSYKWQNEYQLFISGLHVCPLNAKVHYNVAKVADANHQIDWAIVEYKESIRLYPEYYQAMNNLANLLKNKKQFSEAETYLKTALKYKQDFPAAWMNLGIVLAATKHVEESLNAYKNALIYRRNYPDCLYNLGNLYLQINRTEDALNNWFKAIHLKPKHILAWTNLLALLDNTGQINKALQLISKALKELPDAPSIHFAVANIYGKIDRYEESETHFTKAIELFGDGVQAIHYANLGVLYHRWKKYELSATMYKKALSINPLFGSAHQNLKSLQKLNYQT